MIIRGRTFILGERNRISLVWRWRQLWVRAVPCCFSLHLFTICCLTSATVGHFKRLIVHVLIAQFSQSSTAYKRDSTSFFPLFPTYCFLIPLLDSFCTGTLASKKMTKINRTVPLGQAASPRLWRLTLQNQLAGVLGPAVVSGEHVSKPEQWLMVTLRFAQRCVTL